MKTITLTDRQFEYIQECVELVAGDDRQEELLMEVRKVLKLPPLDERFLMSTKKGKKG